MSSPWEVYRKAITAALKAYNKAKDQAWKAYRKATKNGKAED